MGEQAGLLPAVSRLAACTALFGVWECQTQPRCRVPCRRSSLEGRPGARRLCFVSTAISKTGLRLWQTLGSCLNAASQSACAEILRLQGRLIKGRIILGLGRKRIGLK